MLKAEVPEKLRTRFHKPSPSTPETMARTYQVGCSRQKSRPIWRWNFSNFSQFIFSSLLRHDPYRRSPVRKLPMLWTSILAKCATRRKIFMTKVTSSFQKADRSIIFAWNDFSLSIRSCAKSISQSRHQLFGSRTFCMDLTTELDNGQKTALFRATNFLFSRNFDVFRDSGKWLMRLCR